MFLTLTFHYVYADISGVMERKPRYMEPVKLVNRKDNLTYARRHDGNGDGILQSTEQSNRRQTTDSRHWNNDDDRRHTDEIDEFSNGFKQERDEEKERRNRVAVAVGICATTLVLGVTLVVGGHAADSKAAQPPVGKTEIAQQNDTYWGYGGEIQAEQENAPKDQREIVYDIEQLNPDLDQPLQIGDEVKLPDYDQ